MPSQSRKSVRSKVRECLARCSGAPIPLACLAEFVSQLRQEGWEEADIHQVEVTVLKILAGMIGNDEEIERP